MALSPVPSRRVKGRPCVVLAEVAAGLIPHKGLRSRAETRLTRGSEVSQGWRWTRWSRGTGGSPGPPWSVFLDLPSLPGAPPGLVAWLPRSRVAAGQWAA